VILYRRKRGVVRLLWCVLLWPEKSSIKNDEFSSNLLLKIKIDSKIEKDEKKNNMYFFFLPKGPRKEVLCDQKLAGVGGSRWRRRFRHRKYCVVGEKKDTIE
jgi:hypothetical protein